MGSWWKLHFPLITLLLSQDINNEDSFLIYFSGSVNLRPNDALCVYFLLFPPSPFNKMCAFLPTFLYRLRIKSTTLCSNPAGALPKTPRVFMEQ